MTTHYIENASSGSQYYFNNNATTSHAYQSYDSPVRSNYNSSTYSTYPANTSSLSNQQTYSSDSYYAPQNYQSVAGFNRPVTQQHHYQTAHSSIPQSRTTVRAVTSQDLYQLQSSPQIVQVSPQQHHLQFDPRQRPGHPTGPPVVYQTPGASQFTHHNVDTWIEGSNQAYDPQAQAQRVSVRSVSTGSHQQSHSLSPQRHPDQLQQYYSQLTPEQHQHLLRQQQLQRQHEQNSRREQQREIPVQHVSSSSTHHHQQQHRSSADFDRGEHQRRIRSESEKQLQDEQEYYAAQNRLAAQRAQQHQQQQQQQQEDPSHPVGIQNLMGKFTGPASGQVAHSRPKLPSSSSTRPYSGSNYAKPSSPQQKTTNRVFTTHSMTYSALPKSVEPPVNTIEYYQMQMQQNKGNSFASIQQAAAPSHIQQSATGVGGLRDRFKTGSLSEEYHQASTTRRQEPNQLQQSKVNASGGNSLSSLRSHYMNQASQPINDESQMQNVYHISRTIVGEGLPEEIPIQQKAPQEQPAPVAKILQKQPAPTVDVLKEESTPIAQASKQEQTPTNQVHTQQPSPAKEVLSQESSSMVKVLKEEPTNATSVPKQEAAPTAQAVKKESTSTAQTVKKDSTTASQTTKKETTSTTQTVKKETGSTQPPSKPETTAGTEALKEQPKTESSQINNQNTDKKGSSAETATTPTTNDEKV